VINLKPGDLVYYKPHLATGLLIEKDGSRWKYSLRSPTREDLTIFHVKAAWSEEAKFLEGIAKGNLEYYAMA
jgi:hypothetical protein